jgi:hypothetical protein
MSTGANIFITIYIIVYHRQYTHHEEQKDEVEVNVLCFLILEAGEVPLLIHQG